MEGVKEGLKESKECVPASRRLYLADVIREFGASGDVRNFGLGLIGWVSKKFGGETAQEPEKDVIFGG